MEFIVVATSMATGTKAVASQIFGTWLEAYVLMVGYEDQWPVARNTYSILEYEA